MPSRSEREEAARKLRRAIQIALSAVELDEDDVTDMSSIFDEFDPSDKYKKGQVAMSGGSAYRCIKTTKGGDDPAEDHEHWEPVGGSSDTGQQADEYDPSKTYNKGDECSHNGIRYSCLKNNVTGVEPGTDGRCWAALS